MKERLAMALEYGEDVFCIYFFSPMMEIGMGAVNHDNMLYLKFIYPEQPIVYHDLKSFF